MVRIPPLVSVDTETGEVEWLDAVPDGVPFVVVMPLSVPLILPDNLVGTCDVCGRAVQFRPGSAPAPFKICAPCVPAFAEGLERPAH